MLVAGVAVAGAAFDGIGVGSLVRHLLNKFIAKFGYSGVGVTVGVGF